MMLAGLIFNDPEVPWLVSGALTLLFLVFNNALGIFAEKHFRYIQLSLYAFMILIVSLSFLAYLISGQTIFDDGMFGIQTHTVNLTYLLICEDFNHIKIDANHDDYLWTFDYEKLNLNSEILESSNLYHLFVI